MKIREGWRKIKKFTNKCIRVLKITKKPSTKEFKTIAKASGLGIAVIGLIGFILQIIDQLLVM